MKRLITFLLVSIAFQGMQTVLSQPSGNSKTIPIPEKDALKVLQKGYEAKALEQQRDLLLNQVDTLKARISIKDMQLVNKDGQLSDLRNIINSKNGIISIQEEQKKILEQNTAALNKQIKRLQRGKRFTALAGIVSTGIALYFALK